MSKYYDLIDMIIKSAIAKGADEAEVYLEIGRSSQVGTRMGEIETLKESVSRGLGIRVFKDKRMGFAYTSDFNENHLQSLISLAIALSAEASGDEYNGLADTSAYEADTDLDLYDPQIVQIPQPRKIEMCRVMEKTMFAYDKRINNSEGGYFYDGDSETYIGNSLGLRQNYRSSYCYLQCLPIAEQDGKFQAGSWFSIKRFFDEISTPEKVAEIAAQRAVRMLGATTPKTSRVPVVFEPLMAAAVIGNILAAIDGDAIYKRSTFLVDKVNQQIAAEIINIRDDARLPRALGSAPFDGEGMATNNKEIVSQGKLRTYLYDSYTARKAKTKSTANAARGYSSTPDIGAFNFYLANGDVSAEDIIGSVKNGLYVTDIMGYGSDIATGDYSQGASGLWIENGKLTKPVEGLTIASNMLEMLPQIEMIGNDLELVGTVSSPTIKISEMIVAGV